MAAEGAGWWSALKWAWANKAEILNHLKKVREWFRTDPGRGILIIGPGGVGKTTLAALLSGQFDWLLSEPWRYDESYGVDEFTLKDDPKTNIVVPPGQKPRRETMWVDVERSLAAGEYRGVILVSANGYHSLPDQSYKVHPFYKGDKEAFLADYSEACRNDEIAVLNRVAPHLRATAGKLWVLSLIAKEDLWWPERQEAQNHYTTGAYADALAALASARGHQLFRHELVPVSLVINNFLSGTGEMLRKNTDGYDHRKQVESVRRLFEVLGRAAGVGGDKMNATTEAPETTETAEPGINVVEQARIVSGLLKEYVARLAELNAEMLAIPFGSFSSVSPQQLAPRAAWLLDRTELLRNPLSNIISRGSALLEHSTPDAADRLRKVAPIREDRVLDSLTADELALRMREIEIHHHHMLRLAHEIRQGLDTVKLTEQVRKLRMAAGLNAMKGGPLRPNE